MADATTRILPSSDLTADDWFAASTDLAAALRPLYTARAYPLAIYVCGLSVECLLKGLRRRAGSPFRPDHSLLALAGEAGLVDRLPRPDRRECSAALGVLVAVWQNNHRFRSEAVLRRWLKSERLDRRIKGDALKENARRCVEAARRSTLSEQSYGKDQDASRSRTATPGVPPRPSRGRPVGEGETDALAGSQV